MEFGDERLPERFWIKVSVNDVTGCWEWTGAKTRGGYGQLMWPRRGSTAYAHRLTYEIAGDIPKGHQIDHLCRNRGCCNPAHLEAVTPRENILRGDGPDIQRQRHAAKTHCPQGHSYSGDNLRIRVTKSGHKSRICRACINERQSTPEHRAYMRAYRARAAAQARDAA